MIKRYIFCILLFATLIAFGVSSFAIDKPLGDRFYTVDENGFIVDEPEQVSEDGSTTDEPLHVVDSGAPPIEPPTSSVNYEMHFLVIIILLGMVGGIVLCMIFFDRL